MEAKVLKYITYTKARNIYYLTKSMFQEIDPPDLLLKNPHYRNAAPMEPNRENFIIG